MGNMRSTTPTMTPAPAQVRILFPAPLNLGPGKIRLLAAIREHGSISGAARQLRISYRRAWLMVDTLNKSCPGGVVETVAGGSKGGGTRLTPLGEQILDRYQAMQATALAAVAAEAAALLRLIGPAPEGVP